MLLAVCHSTKGWTRVQDLEKLSDLRSESGNLLWAESDVSDLTPDELIDLRYEASIQPEVVASPPLRRPSDLRTLLRMDLSRDPRLARCALQRPSVGRGERRVITGDARAATYRKSSSS